MSFTRIIIVLFLAVISIIAYESRFEHAYPCLNELRTVSGLWFSNFQHFSFGLAATFATLLFFGDMILPISKKESLSCAKKKWITFVLGMIPVIGYIGWWEFYQQAGSSLLAVDYVDVVFDLSGMLVAFLLYRKFIVNDMLAMTDKFGFVVYLLLDLPLFFLLMFLLVMYSRPLSALF